MTQYQYMVLKRYATSPSELKTQLDQYGEQGWELVAVTAEDAEDRLYLKREVPA